MTLETLLQEALKLRHSKRDDLAAELLATLDEKPVDSLDEVERAWAAEIERRARHVLAGESAGVSWHEVKQRIEGRLAKSCCQRCVRRLRAFPSTLHILLQWIRSESGAAFTIDVDPVSGYERHSP